jgi:SAM-dependent methyltransferase
MQVFMFRRHRAQTQPRLTVVTATADPAPAATYFMDSATEGDRLAAKTDPVAVGRHLLMTGLRHGMRALDVACGTGAVTRIMADIAGAGCVTGIDMSQDRIEQAQEAAAGAGIDLSFIVAEANDLPFEDGHFDYVHARMLFEYLPDPARTLAELVRVTKPGGAVVLIDLDGQLEQLSPMPDAVGRDLQDALRILATTGFNPRVGRTLPTLCTQAGLAPVRTWVEPYQVYQNGQLSSGDLRNWREKLATSTRHLARATGDTERWAQFEGGYLRALTAPDAFYYATAIVVRGTVPEDMSQA